MIDAEAGDKSIAKFKRRRRISQVVILFGLALLLTGIFLDGFLKLQFIFLFGGFLIVILGMYFYQSIFGSCPICKKRFLFYKDYNEGLPLFKLIRECPFCRTKL